MEGKISGIALTSVAAGGLFVYLGITGRDILGAAKAVIQGKSPASAPVSFAITSPGAGTGAGGTGGTGLGPSAGGPVAGSGNVSVLQVYKALRDAGVPRAPAIMLTAIAGVESGYNTLAWNQNTATGDDSVGLFQINYLGSLYAPRVALTGMTPEQLHLAGVQGQADAAAKLYAQSGLQPWEPDITSGKVNQFLGGANTAASQAGF